MKWVESAWIMLRPGGIVANWIASIRQPRLTAVFWFLHLLAGARHEPSLPVTREMQMSSRNAPAGPDETSPKPSDADPKTTDSVESAIPMRIISPLSSSENQPRPA